MWCLLARGKTDSYSIAAQLKHSKLGEVGDVLDLCYLVLNEEKASKLMNSLQPSYLRYMVE